MRHFPNMILVVTAVLCAAGPAVKSAGAATIVVVNGDGASEGFNDPTPWTPTGGNPATTLGQARLNAFQYAANLWGARLQSNVTILVNAQMNPLTCTSTSAVLGSAGATTAHRDFTNAPVALTWYPQALANSLAGADLDPTTPDISAQFNSNLNGSAGCLGGIGWYYGYDASPPSSTIDFVSVVLHEIGHGLGFQTFVNLTTGAKLAGYDDTYLLNLNQNGAAQPLYPLMSNAQRVAANISDPNLRWTGAGVTAFHPTIPLTAGLSGSYARVHAPNPVVQGSSVSHFSTALAPNQLMEPSYTAANHNIELTLRLFQDIGWVLTPQCAPEVTTVADTDTLTITQTLASWNLQVEVTNSGSFTARNVTATMSNGPGWLGLTDATCAYPDLAAAASSFGSDSYTLDITSWPGGSFSVDLLVEWEDACGNPYSQSLTVDLLPATLPTGVPGSRYAYGLEPNVPNPFNPSTTIRYELAAAGRATLRVYDISGRLVKTLVDRQMPAGTFEARWDGRDARGVAVASGVYFYRLEAGAFTQTRRMVLLK
jgi:hypothetical protein